MASIVPRRNKAGEILSYQVKWKDGGARSDRWQSERFDDEDSAKVFKDAVEEAGQHWPPGWVKGKGYIDPAAWFGARREVDERRMIGSVDDGAGADSALKAVRTQTPRRAWVWEAGPVRPGRLGGRHESERARTARLVAVGLRGPVYGEACAPRP
ncbi:hypothetical protein [Streptomyces sp900116325]|uniref:hypothetical protein n=1 Tax=Streptomyces sp. 900116325 TaxID=3154295 RepID=UPI0033305FF9